MLLHSKVNKASSIGVPPIPAIFKRNHVEALHFHAIETLLKLPSISSIFKAGRDQDGSKARDPFLFGHESLSLEMERNAKWRPQKINGMNISSSISF